MTILEMECEFSHGSHLKSLRPKRGEVNIQISATDQIIDQLAGPSGERQADMAMTKPEKDVVEFR